MLSVLLFSLAFVSQSPPTAQADSALVYAGPRPVYVMRASLGALSPAERAASASQRLRDALRAGSDSVSVQSLAPGNLLLLGAHPVFMVLPADVDTLAGETLQTATSAAVQALRRAVAEHRETRSARALLEGLGLSVAATLLFVSSLRLIIRVRRRLTLALHHVVAEHLTAIRIRGLTLLERHHVEAVSRTAIATLAWAVGLLLTYAWAAYVLRRFAWTRHWGEVLGSFLVGTTTDLLVDLIHAIPGLFTAFLVFVGARLFSRLLDRIFRAAAEGRVVIPGVHPDTARPTRQILVALTWLFAIIVAYPFLPGSHTDVFKGVTVFAGLLLTLGSSSVVGQGMSGLVLMYTRSLRIGEFVRVGEVQGTVTEVGMLSTKIRTARGEEVTIPSGVLLGSAVQNFSRLTDRTGAVLSATVTIDYDAPWRQVHAMLLEAARRTSGVRVAPEPYVLQRALSDFYVEYELVVQVERAADRIPKASELHGHIQDVFNEHGVQIMSPHYLGDPTSAKVVPPERWHLPPAPPAVAGSQPGV